MLNYSFSSNGGLKVSKLIYIISIFILGINAGSNVIFSGLSGQYIVFLISLFLLSVLISLRRGKVFYYSNPFIFHISSAMVLLWIYGILLGLYKNNDVSYIIRNNAGMTLYILFYLFYLFIDKKLIIKILVISGYIVMISTLVAKFLNEFLGIPLEGTLITGLLGRVVGSGEVRFGRVFFYTQFLVCNVLVLSVYMLMQRKIYLSYYFKWFFLLLISSYVIFFISMSKGITLAGIFSLTALTLLILLKSKFNIQIKIALSVIASSIFIYILMDSSILVNNSLISINDPLQGARFEQVDYLIKDIRFFGQGLGAVIPGYARSDEFAYGFELSYLALFHKFGVFGIFVLVTYFVVLYKIVRFSSLGVYGLSDSAILIASMSFLMPAIGNPGLFSPQEVLTHVLILTYLSKRELV